MYDYIIEFDFLFLFTYFTFIIFILHTTTVLHIKNIWPFYIILKRHLRNKNYFYSILKI